MLTYEGWTINLNSYKEIISSDASLIDANGVSMEVDLSVTLPLVYGQPSEIIIGIPNSSMPISEIKSPWRIQSLQYPKNVILEDVYYSSITKKSVVSRKFGSTAVKLSHIKSLTVEMGLNSATDKFCIYLSGTSFFDIFNPKGEQNLISEICDFHDPYFGNIALKRYSVESRLLDCSGSLKLNGYLLEIQWRDLFSDHELVIERIQPFLNIISLFTRQRVLVCGWEVTANCKNTRHWKYPLERIQTSYSLPKPEKYLVTRDQLHSMVDLGLKNYNNLDQAEMDAVYKLSFNLCSAIDRQVNVKYMALFTALEDFAKKSNFEQKLDKASLKAIELIKESAKPQKEDDHSVYKILMDLTNNIKTSKKAADSISSLLSKYSVYTTDLWPVGGKCGLLYIRNHLAHIGNHGIDHQGLSVATLHLTILIERLVLAILKLTLEHSIEQDSKRDPWLKWDYVERLKSIIIQQ
jgi:hypothetical protein